LEANKGGKECGFRGADMSLKHLQPLILSLALEPSGCHSTERGASSFSLRRGTPLPLATQKTAVSARHHCERCCE
jgi:hypothetical protein